MRIVSWLLWALPLCLQAQPAAIAPPGQSSSFGMPKVDKVVVSKSHYSLSLYSREQLVKRYWVALSPNPRGHKQQEGDKRTPEGTYLLDYKKPDTAYYKAIHISYPNEQDRAEAAAKGLNPGGMILIHGQPNRLASTGTNLQPSNWTDGCIALLNTDMDELWHAIEPGTLIHILP